MANYFQLHLNVTSFISSFMLTMLRSFLIPITIFSLSLAAPSSSPPCYAVIDGASAIGFIQTIETTCSRNIFDYQDLNGVRLVLRSYTPTTAFVVESSVEDDPGNSFDDNIFYTSAFLFDYFTGNNANKQNLSANALTAPFTLRPPVVGRSENEDWIGSMALAPSVWHPSGKPPPASTLATVKVVSYGNLTMAARPVVLSNAPTEDDFRNAYGELENFITFLTIPGGSYRINVSSPFSPSFNFYYTQLYNGTSWQIEAAAEVYFVSS